MSLTKETKWLCENASRLEQFSGQWISFCASDGVLCTGESLQKVMSAVKRQKHPHKPFVFLVPSKERLTPLPGMAPTATE
jgi:hypothetical protein